MSKLNLIEHNMIFQKPKSLPNSSAWYGHIPFAFFLVSALKPRLIVELGVHTGSSLNAFCQAVQTLNLDTVCCGIDTWQGDHQAGFYSSTVYNELAEYHQNENYNKFSKLIRMTFDDAIYEFDDGTIDLLHIDGLHTYEAVRHDFENWLPKLSDKAVVIFHDTEVRKADFGVWKFWEDVSPLFPSFNFTHCFGLGVLAVGTNVDSDFLDFINEAQINPAIINTFTGIAGFLNALMEKDNEAEKLVSLIDQHYTVIEQLSEQNAELTRQIQEINSIKI